MEVFGGEKIGISLVEEIAKAKYTVEILAYLLLAPRGISIPEKKGGLLSMISRKLNEGITFSILFNDKFPAGWLKRRQEEERERLRYMGAEVKTYPRKTILHSKLIIIDRDGLFAFILGHYIFDKAQYHRFSLWIKVR